MMSVMGLESELNLAVAGPSRQAKKPLITALLDQVKQVVPAVVNVEGSPPLPGFMTGNGSRIYVDLGNLIEIATPEVVTPMEAVISLHANERMLLQLLPDVARNLHVNPANVILNRCATSYDGHYRGMHVNVSTRHFEAGALVEHLVPFLVTRFYACAGGIGPQGFVMSHKAVAIRTIVSADARVNRGIIHLKDEPLSGSGTYRLHIAHGDATMATLSTYLSLGCTALVIRMLDDGVCVGPMCKLADPIAALRVLDTDYTWSAPLLLASGCEGSALDIQEHYLRAAERYASRKGVAWMRDVTGRWRTAVDTLRAQGPPGLARDCDAYAKRKLYVAYLNRLGTTLAEFSCWCGPVAAARPYLSLGPCTTPRQRLQERMPAVRFTFLEERMRRHRLAWSELPRAAALYERMVALDLLYHDVSELGLFGRLCSAGAIRSLFGKAEVLAAMRQPPRGTRAEARARAITEVANDASARGNWLEIRTTSRRAEFKDPMCTTFTWAAQKAK